MMESEKPLPITEEPKSSPSITTKTSTHGANKCTFRNGPPATTAEELLKGSYPVKHRECNSILQSSFQLSTTTCSTYPSTNGFVKAAIEAYNQHHHLIIRPEDIWFAILTQFSSYVNGNAEKLRSHFVAHEGQKELEIKTYGGSRYPVDFSWFAEKMGRLLEQNVVDNELRE
ncbi:hypothetical protein OEA41_000675 [Lepraria neglecta]|uniref:Uncharacterized protein n=1 Tax=Lepraria neglecta TaxID=209136 RepID=A0AAD9ZIM6_9LECA|nr:hypothetical protein OEA41_000675 [Lepraria neglecta]